MRKGDKMFEKPFNGLLDIIQGLWKVGMLSAGDRVKLLTQLHNARNTDHLVCLSYEIAHIIGGRYE